MSNTLTVYKASAGSGKTFTLAVEYIKLLITDPYSYNKILAVTFTNKATEEMKMRILSQLYGIWKLLPDSYNYTNKICTSLGINEDSASIRAGIALSNLLHNYNYFRIETIDSFFQSILRNLARELDLTTNLRLGLNDWQVEELAVDRIIESLDKRNEILFWIIDYIKENISDDKSWNVINEIKKFGRTIFDDKYKDSSDELAHFMEEKGRFDRYVKSIRNERDGAKDKMQKYGELFMETIDEAGLSVNDFKYAKSGVYGFFVKLIKGVFDESIKGKRVLECVEDPTCWYNKKAPNAQYVHSVVVAKLHGILSEALNDCNKQWLRYKSAELTLKHINQIRLLHIIERKVKELNNEANRFLLSDTQHLLYSLIDGSDTPFIFEKTGGSLSHIMIDEFQDTSTVQWQNFKVLLLDSMSQEGAHNLIVGDVKQSIYRWRSGDWRLLSNITDEFGKDSSMLKMVTLDTNYRSQRNIINFNNAFFETATSESDVGEIKKAYMDVAQKIPSEKKENGYVHIGLLPSENYDDNTLKHIKEYVEELIAIGVKQSDIAILVRLNSHIPKIAHYLQSELHHKDISIVSDEAFRLDSSISVNIIISALCLIVNPDDILAKASLVKAYQRRIVGTILTDADFLTESKSLNDWLPVEFIDNMQVLQRMPLYELCQEIYKMFQLETLISEGSYITLFNDKLSDFIAENSSDINMFLKEWTDNICTSNIQGAEFNGIRLLSIHKSKGLEFENVIIPYCDWKLEKTNGNILLCNTDYEPYGLMPLIPIDYNSKMIGTVYEKDYNEEYSQNIVDNMNLLYVAFTRASSNLFIIGKRNAKGTRSELIEICLDKVAEKLGLVEYDANKNPEDTLIFEYGNIYINDNIKESKSINVFLQKPENQTVNISSKMISVEFRQSNDSKKFTSEDNDKTNENDYLKIGLILHEILSTIKTKDDIDSALFQLECQGILYDYDDLLTINHIKKLLIKRLSDPLISEWFSGKWDSVNETTILSINRQTGKVQERRPDRVMIKGTDAMVVDFKFGNHKADHVCQVEEYMRLLNSMGYTNVRGYIWYVYTNKIIEV